LDEVGLIVGSTVIGVATGGGGEGSGTFGLGEQPATRFSRPQAKRIANGVFIDIPIF
jgi:hypothetical protein